MKTKRFSDLRYNTVNYDEIVQIHENILKSFGGASGMNSEGNLHFLVDHIKH